jgi:chromosome segregation ATPase
MSADMRDGQSLERADRFDFERLEQSVDSLLKDHQRISAEREALMAELVDREHRIASLEAKLREERSRRATALEGVDRVLSRVASLQQRITGANGGDESAAGTEGASR